MYGEAWYNVNYRYKYIDFLFELKDLDFGSPFFCSVLLQMKGSQRGRRKIWHGMLPGRIVQVLRRWDLLRNAPQGTSTWYWYRSKYLPEAPTR